MDEQYRLFLYFPDDKYSERTLQHIRLKTNEEETNLSMTQYLAIGKTTHS